MQAYEFIEDHHLVTNVFGRWPSFHDAEVHRVVLHRTSEGRKVPQRRSAIARLANDFRDHAIWALQARAPVLSSSSLRASL